ncbi:MAG: YafY family transcriptional regulator [Methylobacterium sp.]|nr:YafY family transcriptional regulator [Methylobacterium sp.]MCA3600013.1 YafY family transcriptional regulator [Methylobacterium sp.]MCA3607551.1 YafY family transcriptional regulator [Methylobacterium sp.]MCA3609485.1 YafY family transcriptional regulator [Methylobacterium sp.]MCA3611728.1 YafY family transcriptional regulator [Methylobacterium sp.]
MARADRLIQLTQALRRHRRPVTAAMLAEETGVSERTIYRDIISLQVSGVPVRGEAGIGYVLESGFDLPPLMFTPEECEALMLGLRFVRDRSDAGLQRVIDDTRAKIEAILPPALKESFNTAPLFAPVYRPREVSRIDESLLRRALREWRKIRIRYRDGKEEETIRVVWPVALGYFETTRGLSAWCEMRQGFRHFRTDRIEELTSLDEKIPRRRTLLMRDWEEALEAEHDATGYHNRPVSQPV